MEFKVENKSSKTEEGREGRSDELGIAEGMTSK